jgi:hypothetical protein
MGPQLHTSVRQAQFSAEQKVVLMKASIKPKAFD